MSESTEKVIPTTCASHCGGTCVFKVHVRDGVITRIETDDGPEPQLRACWRGRAYRQRVYHPDRLLYPLKRTGERGEGKFERITWDEALDTVARELIRVRDTYGPASILYLGVGGDLATVHTLGPMNRLLCLFGGYTRPWGAASFAGGTYASLATYGTWFDGNTRDDLVNSRLILLWGWDPAVTVSGTNTGWYLAQAREAGAKIIAVDPKFTDSAAVFAQQWIPIRPGTDAALLIAMAYVIIQENLQDQRFLDTYTVGFDRYKDYVLGVEDGQPKTPAWAEAITGVPAATIEALARQYATTKPAALMAGIAPGRSAYGEQYHRAANVLAAMTGNIGVHGADAAGRVWQSIAGGYPYNISSGIGYGAGGVSNPVDAVPRPPRGSPPAYRASRVHLCKIADFILKGKVGGYPADCKLIYMVNTNYLNQLPNINRIVQALRKVEFIALQEQFMTPTAKFADIILPTTTFLERNDIDVGVGLAFYGFVNKVIEPLGECKSHLEIAAELAQHLGIEDFGESDDEALLRQTVANSEISDYDSFKEKGVYRLPLSEPYVAFKKQIEDPGRNPFPTPSGRIEIYSQQWADLGNPELPPIPKYIETWESRNDPLAKRYPLQLITTHYRRRALSQFENVPWLRALQNQVVFINPEDALARGISDGDRVRVFNHRGETIIPAKVTERIMPGVVDVPHGAWYEPDKKGLDRGGCANVLTSERISPGGAFAYNTGLVQVEKA